VFIADGTGIAPIRPMLRRAVATATGRPLRLLAGAAARDRVRYRDDLDAFAREHPAFRWDPVPSAELADEVRRRWVDGDAGPSPPTRTSRNGVAFMSGRASSAVYAR